MSPRQKRIRETMAANASPDPVGSPALSLETDVEVDRSAWAMLAGQAEDLCRTFAAAAFEHIQKIGEFESDGFDVAEIAIRLTTDAELQALNNQFRGIDKPTNVLSFAALDDDAPLFPEDGPLTLGDIAVAAETIQREALAQGKTVQDHLAHMVVHGVLHLLGYDHEEEAEAEEMESLEREILAMQGIADPYEGAEGTD